MFCQDCGNRLNDASTSCPACGKSPRTPPPVRTDGRIASHLRLLGILWLALSAFRLIPGFTLLLMSGAGWAFLTPEIPGFVPGLLAAIGALLSLSSVVGIIAGWGLLEREPWARILAIVLGCLGLMDVPFGTAMGVYTLWVLLPDDSARAYSRASAEFPVQRPVSA